MTDDHSSVEAVVPSLDYPTSWPRAATPTNLIPLWAGEFKSHGDWVSFATKRLTGCRHPYGHEVAPICVDALGRRCSIGGDFMRARDEDAFPVRYFWECVAPSDQDKLVGELAAGELVGPIASFLSRYAGLEGAREAMAALDNLTLTRARQSGSAEQ